MKRILLCIVVALSALCGLSACAPATSGATGARTPDIVGVRDGLDLLIPNPGEALQDHWGLTLDVSPDWQTNADGMLWCPTRQMLTSKELGYYIRYSCDMPGLAQNAQRRIKTLTGKILDYAGSGYRASSGTTILQIGPPPK